MVVAKGTAVRRLFISKPARCRAPAPPRGQLQLEPLDHQVPRAFCSTNSSSVAPRCHTCSTANVCQDEGQIPGTSSRTVGCLGRLGAQQLSDSCTIGHRNGHLAAAKDIALLPAHDLRRTPRPAQRFSAASGPVRRRASRTTRALPPAHRSGPRGADDLAPVRRPDRQLRGARARCALRSAAGTRRAGAPLRGRKRKTVIVSSAQGWNAVHSHPLPQSHERHQAVGVMTSPAENPQCRAHRNHTWQDRYRRLKCWPAIAPKTSTAHNDAGI